MEKKKVSYALSSHARKLLLVCFPMIILYLIAMIAYILPLEGMEFIRREAIIIAFFDAVCRGLVFLTIGTVAIDHMEKRYEMNKG